MKSSILFVFISLISSSAFADITVTVGQTKKLPYCKGTVKVTKTEDNRNDKINLVFKHVENCSNFDILTANGEETSYKAKKIPGDNQDRSGSFTLPSKIVDDGYNRVKVIVKSNSGKHFDKINVRFRANDDGYYIND